MSSTRNRWLAFALWSVVVFTAVPYANDIQSWLRRQLGDGALFFGLVAGLVLMVAAEVRWLSIHRREQLWPCLLWVLAISAVIAAWGWALRDAAGAGHLVAFSILGALAFRALQASFRDAGVYLAAATLTSIAGTIDEFLQWLTPGRYWDLADLGVNAGTGALIQLLIWKGIRPSGIAAGISPRSWSLVVRWLAIQVLLILLCLSNTPGRIAWYASRIPGLDYLGQQRSTRMIEYGHLLVDPEIGRFRSRMSREELARLDREQGAEAGRVLREHRQPQRHAELAKAYPSWRDPLIVEMREHLNARNRERGQALKNLDSDRELALRHFTAAYREQLILERFFGNTFDHFGDGLRPVDREQLETLQQADVAFESDIAPWLETRFSEAGVRGLLLAVLALLVAVDRLAVRQAKPSP